MKAFNQNATAEVPSAENNITNSIKHFYQFNVPNVYIKLVFLALLLLTSNVRLVQNDPTLGACTMKLITAVIYGFLY